MIIALQNIIFLSCKIIQLRRCSFNNPNVYKKYDSIINHIKVDVPLTSFSFIQSKYVTPIYPFYRTMPFPKVVKAKNIYSYIWHNVILKQIGFILFIYPSPLLPNISRRLALLHLLLFSLSFSCYCDGIYFYLGVAGQMQKHQG